MNIELDTNISEEIVKSAKEADLIFSSMNDKNLQYLHSFVFENKQEPTFIQKLSKKIISHTFQITHNNDKAFQEITIGLIDKPYDIFVSDFNPAQEWGKNLQAYIDGELIIDEKDTEERPILIRERMIIDTPWYAIGAPQMDMSKYEVIQHKDSSTKILWDVKNSENNSVFQDTGYLLFKEVTIDNKEKTCVLFNSIHRTDPGLISKFLPPFITNKLTLLTLKGLFTSHIKNYQKIITD